MISIIIPVYNGEKTIAACLEAIFRSSYKDYEIIVVDDGSEDRSAEIVEGFNEGVRLIRQQTSGPASARNKGAELAKGEILFFIDSDVLIREDTLKVISDTFRKDPEIAAIVGVYAKDSISKGFFPQYDSLRKHYEWTNTMCNYTTIFTTARGAIKKGIFNEIGGFDEGYKGALVEDFKFGYRLSDKYKILLDKELQGSHYSPSFVKGIETFYQRSFLWARLFIKRKKFDNVKTTKLAALNSLIAFSGTIQMLISIVLPSLTLPGLLCLGIHLLINLRFYHFVLMERGYVFMLQSIFMLYIMSLVIFFGGLMSIFMIPIEMMIRHEIFKDS